LLYNPADVSPVYHTQGADFAHSSIFWTWLMSAFVNVTWLMSALFFKPWGLISPNPPDSGPSGCQPLLVYPDLFIKPVGLRVIIISMVACPLALDR
jgi:hypothetical protein